jgi:hypothetical protein
MRSLTTKSDLKKESNENISDSKRHKQLRSNEQLEEKETKKQVQFPKTAGIIFLGTKKYINYFPRYYKNIKEFFLPEIKKVFFVFTDRVEEQFLKKEDIQVIKIKHEGATTMLRAYEHMFKAEKQLKKQDYVIWLDADMQIIVPIHSKNFFFHDKPLFSIRHPNFLSKKGSFETNPKSLAAVKPEEDLSEYVQACFWGGKSKYALELVKELKKRIETDLKNGVSAKLQDESHLNKYFVENKKLFYIYNPTYAYPPSRPLPKGFKKKILHVYKRSFKTNKP